MKKILCIAAVLVLAGGVASAKTIARAAPEVEVRHLASLDAQGSLASLDVADSGFVIMYHNTAIFMGNTDTRISDDDGMLGFIHEENAEDDGLLKGPRAHALDFCGQKTNLSAATEVDLLHTGKTDAAISMGDASRRDTQVAFIHSPPNNSGSSGITIIG